MSMFCRILRVQNGTALRIIGRSGTPEKAEGGRLRSMPLILRRRNETVIIDVHTHLFPAKIAEAALRKMQGNSHTALYSDGTEAGLCACEARAGVDLAIAQPVATNPEKVSHLNDFVLEINGRDAGSRVRSFGAMHPACRDWERELERLKMAGVPGIKLHPPYTGVDLDDPRSIAVLRKCRELDLMVLIHSGRDVGLPGAEEALPIRVRCALDAVGPMKLIAGHMGGWGCWEEVLELLPDTGCYLDTAFALGTMTPAPDGHAWRAEDLRLLRAEAFCELIARFGADRVLFGTDSPWADPEEEIRKIKGLPLQEAEVRRILGDNMAGLLAGRVNAECWRLPGPAAWQAQAPET